MYQPTPLESFLSNLLFRISVIASNSELSDAAKIKQIKAALAGAAAVPTIGIIERLAVSLKTEAGFACTNPNLTSELCPTATEPSLEGVQLEQKLVGSRTSVLAKLKSDGRRSATVAEGLLYGLTYPEELSGSSWIWCLDQVVVIDGNEWVLVLDVCEDGRCADFRYAECGLRAYDRVLSFPMTAAEIAQCDAEDAERRNA